MDLTKIENENKLIDLNDKIVPECLYWNIDQVCKYFDDLGLPEYKVYILFYSFI